jgi:hypothetical protein
VELHQRIMPSPPTKAAATGVSASPVPGSTIRGAL